MNEFIDAAMGHIRAEGVTREEGSDRAVIDTTRIDPAFPSGFVIYELLNSGWGFKGDVIDRIAEAVGRGDSGRRFYSRDYAAYTDRGRIIVEPILADDVCEVTFDQGATRVYAGNAVYYMNRLDIDLVESLSVPESIALVDADRLVWPLSLRRWREGDRFIPFGMQGGKKVSDYLIDAKISLPEKQRQFVLVNGNGEIVWLAGRRLDDRYKITPRTENVLKIVKEII